MKTIKNYETHIDVDKHVNIQKKNGILMFTGPLGITLINLALHDKNGNSQLSLLRKEEKSVICFKSCNKTFFKCMLNTIKDKMHIVLNGFLVSMHIRGVGYRVELQNTKTNIPCVHTENGAISLPETKRDFVKSTLSLQETQTLFFKIGFSHDFKYICPSSVRMFTKQQTLVCIYGIDRNQVSTIAAKIRMIKKPSVYKPNGITFLNEKITYKQGKRK